MKLYRVNAMMLKYMYITKNRVDRLFDIIYWPVLNIFIWGFLTIYINKISNYNLLSMILGGIILWLFVWRSTQDMGIFVLEEFWNRDLYHLYSSPIKPSEHILAIIITGLVRALAAFLLVLAVSFIFYSFNVFIFGIYLPLFVLLLTLVGWVLGIFIVSMIFRWGHRIQVFAWSIPFGIQPFCCILYPLSALPAWAVPIAVALPPTHVFEAMRDVIAGNPLPWNHIIYAVGTTLVLLVIGAAVLGKAIRHARRTGLLAKVD
jgi:ABC-2 type transport system permease protein